MPLLPFAPKNVNNKPIPKFICASVTKEEITEVLESAQIIYTRTPRITTCLIKIAQGGFEITGESGILDESQFDAQVGNEMALEAAAQKLWAHLAFYKNVKQFIIANKPRKRK